MGNRASVSFKRGDRESITVFSHWDGEQLWEAAEQFVDNLKCDIGQGLVRQGSPLFRLDPETVVINFVRSGLAEINLLGESPYLEHNYYLGKDEDDGDNSDNGHKTIEL